MDKETAGSKLRPIAGEAGPSRTQLLTAFSLAVALLSSGCSTSAPDFRLTKDPPILEAPPFAPALVSRPLEGGRMAVLLPAGLPPAEAEAMQATLASRLTASAIWTGIPLQPPVRPVTRSGLLQVAADRGATHLFSIEAIEYRDYPPYRLTLKLAVVELPAGATIYEALTPLDTRQQLDVLAARHYAQQSVDRRNLGPNGSYVILERRDLFLEFAADRVASGFLEHTRTAPHGVRMPRSR